MKRNNDYCGAYELIKHDKLKNECFKSKQQKDEHKLDNVQKILDRTKNKKEHKDS